jgi:hypothetical protein
MKNVFEAEGEIRSVDPLAALVGCWREKTSGSLRLSRGAAECGFDLEEGDVVGVVSSDPRFETAAILVRAGKLAADAVDRLAPQGGDPALAALQTGLLTRREWKWGEKIRAIEVLSDLLSWNDGRYRFDTEARRRSGDFRLPVPRLLLELFLRSRDRNLVDHQLGPPEQTLVRSELFDVEFPSFGLTADAESVVRLIDGRSTASQIAEKAPAEEFAVRKLLAALVTLGLVHPVPTPAARPSEHAADRERETESVFAPTGSPPPVEPEPDSQAAAELPSEGAETFERSVSEVVEEREPMVDLPEEDGSTLDRFEPDVPAQAREPEAPPEAREPGDLWGSPGDAPEPSEPLEPVPSGSRGAGTALAWIVGILLAAVAAVVLFRSRGPAPGASPATALPTAMPAVAFPRPATAIRLQPTSGRPAEAPTAAPASVTPAREARRAAGREPAPARAIPPEAPPDSREAWLRRAERDRRRLEGDRRTRYAIQLALFCEIPSLADAWRYDRGQAMWLLPVTHGGRDCFRLLWGRYPTLEAAKREKAGIPAPFSTPRNHPAVVAVR